MPIGVFINVAAVAVGGIGGSLFSKKIPERIKTSLTTVFGLCAVGLGIIAVTRATAMPAVVLSTILGALLGELLQLNIHISKLFSKALSALPFDKDHFDLQTFVTLAVMFCASSMGIYGAIMEGVVGDSSFLISKAFLDFFTAIIFSASLGLAVGLIALPQLAVLIAFFFVGLLGRDAIDVQQFQNFIACGGLVTIAAGLTLSGIKQFTLVNILPSLIFILPLTWVYGQLF